MAPQLRDQDRYDILGEHGRGGLGRVSRAHDRELGRDIAIKELISRGHLGEVRFLREALITARLEHPGIVPVYEAGRWPDGTPFYAMKLVSGRPLRDLIAERKTVDERIGLLHHVIAVADAIAYAHGRNIIHRDLKPANVIVGEFGETVVIDWGLAKDLSTTDEPASASGSFRSSPDDGLTSAGTVLGTPAYMSPEQARGEPVDPRADVFAIGAMLWELCSLHKLPPGFSGQRRRLLRTAGIDSDLVTIIEKAVDPDPARRYPDAGALAADLKAFKAGARIAARRYSPWAMFTHWVRRHRTLALSAMGMIAFALVGVVMYIHSVAVERDRADASEERAVHAQASAEASLDDLTLKHAQLLLATDPSAAIDAVTTYQGNDRARASQIRAEAKGHGTAALRATPHTGSIRWVHGNPDGTIVSLSADGTIARTTPDGSSVILARGVASSTAMSYSTSKHLIAYACDPSDLCLYDTAHNSRLPITPSFRELHPVGLSFRRDGTALAVMSRDGTFRIVDVTNQAQSMVRLIRHMAGGSDIVFFRDDVVVADSPSGVEFVHMDGSSESFKVMDDSFWDTDQAQRRFALATTRGHAFIFSGSRVRIEKQLDLCAGPIIGLQFIPEEQQVAYGCRDGTIGLWDIERNIASPRIRVEGHADQISVDSTGGYLFVGGANGVITVLDLHTNLVNLYRGHAFRLNTIVAPTHEYPLLLSADVGGALRAWRLPPRIVNVATTLNSQFHSAIFDKYTQTVIATTLLPALIVYSPDHGNRAIGPHDPFALSLVQSDDGKIFAAYGPHEFVEVWSSTTIKQTSVINTKQGSISQVSFVDNTGDIVTSGHDGRLVHWTTDGRQAMLAQIDEPIAAFALLPEQNSAVFSDMEGSLWRTGANHQQILLRKATSRITCMVTTPSRQIVMIGYASGDVVALDPISWKLDTILHASGAVRDIAITPDGRWMAVSTKDGMIHVGTRPSTTSPFTQLTWIDLAVRARHHALASDGVLVAVCTDGTIWVYSIPGQRWLCVPIASADLRWVTITANETAAAALDLEGRLFWMDLNVARTLLASDR